MNTDQGLGRISRSC